jgi:hypothetical protein
MNQLGPKYTLRQNRIGVYILSASSAIRPLQRPYLFTRILSTIIVCPGLPDFLGTIYQHGERYTKVPQNIPNGLKID